MKRARVPVLAGVLLVAALAVIAAANDEPLPTSPPLGSNGLCIPGSVWKEDCNVCRCSPSSLKACTRKGCVKLPPSTGSSTSSSTSSSTTPGADTEAECQPGAVWKEDCNTCSCSDNGRALCTEMGCQIVKPTQQSADRCTPGSTWKEECNSCRCTEKGLAMCTAMACNVLNLVDQMKQEPTDQQQQEETVRVKRQSIGGGRCNSPGKVWQDDCNTCRCTSKGLAICTAMACNINLTPSHRIKRQETQSRCTPGSTWNKDCNSCICSDDGIPLCTLKGCLSDLSLNPTQPQQESVMRGKRQSNNGYDSCSPGSVWKEDCNTCRCSESGVPFCTLIGCLTNVKLEPTKQQENARKKRQSGYDNSCTPGRVWKEACNTCRCSDGGVPMCTLIGCLEQQAATEQPAQQTCTPGTTWREDCNTCRCGSTGLPSCTYKACPKQKRSMASVAPRVDDTCEPGSFWREGCEACHCSASSEPLCETVLPCVEEPSLVPKRTARKPGLPGLPGRCWKKCAIATDQSERDECLARCGSSIKGGTVTPTTTTEATTPAVVEVTSSSGAATTASPASSASSSECVPGSRWQQDCNTCWCSSGGRAACTLMACLGGSGSVSGLPGWTPPPLRRPPLRVPEPSDADCRPGSVWRRGCNWCRCVRGGAACTRMRCPPALLDAIAAAATTSTTSPDVVLEA